MGQTEQQTLLPFFGKCSSSHPWDIPNTPIPQPSLPDHDTGISSPRTAGPQLPPEYNNTADNKSQSLLSRKDGSRRNGLIVLKTNPTETNRAKNDQTSSAEEHNGHRKKRRKKDSPKTLVSIVSDTPVAEGGPTVQDPSLPEQGTKATDTENNSLDMMASRETGDTAPSSKEPMKIMRLNPNGKLRSSPPLEGNSSDQSPSGGSRRASSRIKARKEALPPTKLVTISYGSGDKPRQHLGNLINDIMAGRTRHIQRPTVKQSKAQKKSTHPFFLPKSAQNTAVPVDNGENLPQPSSYATVEGGNAQRTTSTTTKPVDLAQLFPSRAKKASAFPLLLQRPRRSDGNELVNPLWPPREMVHVQDVGDWNRHDTLYLPPLKKAKDRALFIDESEDVLSIRASRLRKLLHEDRNKTCARNILCRPKKSRLAGSELQRTVIDRLSNGTVTKLRGNPGELVSGSLHPALAKLISSLKTAIGSFDRGGFEENSWIHKYSPKCAAEVLQAGSEASVLRNWLQNLVVSSVSTTATGKSDSKQLKQKKENVGRKKKRKKPKDLEGFLVSSSDEAPVMDELGGSDEDELAGGCTIFSKRSVIKHDGQEPGLKPGAQRRPVSKSVLLSGPSGSGKTAAVYAVANELGFEVFEINSGSRRTAKDLVERVGDMTQNHLVHLLNQADGDSMNGLITTPEAPSETADTGNQSTMANFFKKKEPPAENQLKLIQKAPDKENPSHTAKDPRSQKQSLILLEEVDVLFNEDKQFWSGVLALISQSKRPVVMTCNDESLIPLDDIDFHAILRFKRPSSDIATDYLLLLAANEGHLLDRGLISNLLTVHNRDMRATIMQLNFWCQMAVGSRKAGLDWLNNQWLCCGGTLSSSIPRTVSCNTYSSRTGWYCTDTSIGEPDSHEKKLQLLTEGMEQWGLGITEWLERRQDPLSCGGSYGINALEEASYMADMRGVLDLLCQGSSDNWAKHSLDNSLPPIPDKQRLDYIEGQQLLQSDTLPHHSNLSISIGASLSILLEESLSSNSSIGEESDITTHALEKSNRPAPLQPSTFRHAFQPIIDPPDVFPPASSHRPLTFDNTATIAVDVAPFIRAIVAFDMNLEQHRIRLGGPVSQDGVPPSKRMRTTRASRAALEGGDKENIRRERWFSGRLQPGRIMATGGEGWDEILQRQYERHYGVGESCSSGEHSQHSNQPLDSSSEGGI